MSDPADAAEGELRRHIAEVVAACDPQALAEILAKAIWHAPSADGRTRSADDWLERLEEQRCEAGLSGHLPEELCDGCEEGS